MNTPRKPRDGATTTYHLRLRAYPDGRFVSVWLVRRQYGADSALLFGDLLPCAVEEIVAALGLPVERDDSPLEGLRPITPTGCVGVERQAELFAEDGQ